MRPASAATHNNEFRVGRCLNLPHLCFFQTWIFIIWFRNQVAWLGVDLKPQTFQGICLREGSFLKSEVLLNLPTHMPSSKNHINHVYRHSIYIYIHIPFRFIPSPPTPREVSPWWLHIFFSTFHPSFTPETETSKFLEQGIPTGNLPQRTGPPTFSLPSPSPSSGWGWFPASKRSKMKLKWAYWIGVFLVVDHWLVHFKAWKCETNTLRKIKG